MTAADTLRRKQAFGPSDFPLLSVLADIVEAADRLDAAHGDFLARNGGTKDIQKLRAVLSRLDAQLGDTA